MIAIFGDPPVPDHSGQYVSLFVVEAVQVVGELYTFRNILQLRRYGECNAVNAWQQHV